MTRANRHHIPGQVWHITNQCHNMLQSLIELSLVGNEERTFLESLCNHIQAKGATAETAQEGLGL